MRAGAKLKLLDLFSGIGGFSLGLERTGGFETVAFCEIEDFPRRVLAKHWPEVPCYEDIRELNAGTLQRDGIAVDAICGGFPCQDISTAGKGAGIEGERSGLWSEYARLIGELRPSVVFVENVSALLGRGLDKVLGDLAALGYDAEWHCIPASAVGAPHRRDRLWIMAYATGERCREARKSSARPSQWPASTSAEPRHVADPLCVGYDRAPSSKATAHHQERDTTPPECRGRAVSGSPVSSCEVLANTERLGCNAVVTPITSGAESQETASPIMYGGLPGGRKRWESEPAICRVVDGVSDRSHRLKGLGNAVVPQIPELLGNAYLEAIGWGAP